MYKTIIENDLCFYIDKPFSRKDCNNELLGKTLKDIQFL